MTPSIWCLIHVPARTGATKTIGRVMAEAPRVLRPGGLMLHMELPPNTQMGAFEGFYWIGNRHQLVAAVLQGLQGPLAGAVVDRCGFDGVVASSIRGAERRGRCTVRRPSMRPSRPNQASSTRKRPGAAAGIDGSDLCWKVTRARRASKQPAGDASAHRRPRGCAARHLWPGRTAAVLPGSRHGPIRCRGAEATQEPWVMTERVETLDRLSAAKRPFSRSISTPCSMIRGRGGTRRQDERFRQPRARSAARTPVMIQVTHG